MNEGVKELREVPHASQYPGEPHRRWFSGHDCDLIVWDDSAGKIVGFQLCYNKRTQEHAITWRADAGWIHNRVEYDDPTWGRGYGGARGYALMQPDGVFDTEAVVRMFKAESCHIDPVVVEFVLARLAAYDDR